jgi:glycosyltransferase involved in cell wall biosynthesis/nucleotide-binding universal stress UspA family protein
LQARQVRQVMRQQEDGGRTRSLGHVRVSTRPIDELFNAVREEDPELLILESPCHFEALGAGLEEALQRSPCDVAIVRGPIAGKPENILVPLRGGPYAELALRISLSITRNTDARITSLHITPTQALKSYEAPFRGLAYVLAHLPEVTALQVQTDQPAEAILEASQGKDLVVLGATAQPQTAVVTVGPVVNRILRESPAGVMVVKTRRSLPDDLQSERMGQTAISVLVDKWFAENTFHADEFSEMGQLLALKRQQGVTISVAMPALNEEVTVGNVIHTIKAALMDDVQLLDEIVLMDSDSVDATRMIASELGVPVYIHQQTLPNYGARRGKGEALWKSLYTTRGDILIWIDTDIANIHPRFVYGLLGPLLVNPRLQFVKGFYRRPLRVGDRIQAGGGGRVTELTARPLLNLFFPELSGIIQPLSGEYGGRRKALESLPFSSGYGVEIGLLIDVLEKFGLNAVAQVDLLERIHHNQPLESLSKMSFAIIQTVMRKMERRFGRNVLEEVNKTMKLIHYEGGRFFLDIEEIAELERPPMIELPEYQERVLT